MSARFKPYPSYKDSGVEWLGRIPAHWQVKRLRFATTVNPSKTELRGRSGDTVLSFLPMERIGEDGSLDLGETRRLDQVAQGFTYFRDGDVLVAKITPCFENGKGGICRGLVGGVGFGTTELHVLRPLAEIDSAFLFYITKSTAFRWFGMITMYGAAGQQRVSEEFIRDFGLPLPELTEQTAIATFLDRETGQIDALVKKKERLIELLQEKRTALISHAVTQGLNPNAPKKDSSIPWLGHIPKHWQLKKLGQVAMIVRGGSPRPAGDPRFFDGDACPWITVAEITKDSGKFLNETETRLTEEGRRQSRFLKAGTLVMSNSGATLGVPKILNIAGCINDGSVAFLDLNPSVSRNYLYCYLSSLTENYRDRIKQGSGQPNLNTAIVRSTWFPVGDIAEQDQIVEFLDRETAKLDALMAKVRTAIERLQEYRTALISAAVTGQIDVRSVSTL